MNDMSGHDMLDQESACPREAGASLRRRRAAAADPTDLMTLMNEMLIAQARSLDAMFAELAEHATRDIEWLEPASVYARLALRAQANCRASLGELARADRAERRMSDSAEK